MEKELLKHTFDDDAILEAVKEPDSILLYLDDASRVHLSKNDLICMLDILEPRPKITKDDLLMAMSKLSCEVKTMISPYNEIADELERAFSENGRFHSSHEAIGVLFEEVVEVWEEVRSNILVNQRAELVQVAAMAVKFIKFLDDGPLKPCTTMATAAYFHSAPTGDLSMGNSYVKGWDRPTGS